MDDFMPHVLAICMIVLAFVLICGATAFVLQAIDECGAKAHRTDGVVSTVYFYPAHDETYFNVALKMPQTRHVPDKWSIELTTPKGKGIMDLSQAPDRWFAKDSEVLVDYSVGRVSGELKILKIHPRPLDVSATDKLK